MLRDGLNVGVLSMKESRIDQVISMMIGRQIDEYYPHSERAFGEDVLTVEGLDGDGIHRVSFAV